MDESQEIVDILEDMLNNSDHHILGFPEDLPICGIEPSEDYIYHDYYYGMINDCKRPNMCPVCLIIAESRDRFRDSKKERTDGR